MEQQILMELEAAAKVLLAVPSQVSHQQRSEAEAVFMNFRRTKCPYQICRYIFENSRVDFVVFETCNALKEALIREWNSLEPSDTNSIRHYLLQHVLSHPDIPVYVREKILHVIAIVVKRGSITDEGEERRKLLGEVEQLIMDGELRKQILGCSMVCALLQEYANTAKSADVGISLETHLTAKRQFEMSDLKNIFQLCVTVLSEVCKVEGPFNDNFYSLVKSLLLIADGVLMWNYIPPSWAKKYSHRGDLMWTMKLGGHWKDLMLDPSLVQLFFHLHWKIRDNAQLTHHSLNCLVQLAQLGGPVVHNLKERIGFMKNYLECLLGFVNSVEIIDREAIGVSNIFYRVFLHHDQIITDDPNESGYGDLTANFLRQMAQLTCYFAEKSALPVQDSLDCDESMFVEAFDIMLKAWNCFFRRNSSSVFNEASKCIFDSYLRWHLSPPHGFRKKVSSEDVADNEDEDDLSTFDTQLQCIGIFARRTLDHSLPTLAKLIEEKTYELRLVWQGASNNNVQRDELYEDLHWLLMIAGNVITKERDATGTSAVAVPSSILKYCARRTANANLNDSLSLLTTIDRPVVQNDFPRLEESTDHVIWLVSSVLRLSELEKQMGEAKLTHIMSPTLTSTVAWFLQTWCTAYLLNPRLHSRDEGAGALTSAFDPQSECAKWLINFLINKIQSNMCLFNADPSIMRRTGKLFLSLVDTADKALYMLENNFFLNIINNGLTCNNRYISSEFKKTLMRGYICALAPFANDNVKRREYQDQMLKPIIQKFRSIIMQENFKKVYHDEAVRNEIMEIIQLLQGVVEGKSVVVHRTVFEYVVPILPDMVSLISVYNNYQQIIQLVLELFRGCAHILYYDYEAENINLFFESCLRLVEVYVKHNTNRLTEEVNAEEDSFNDLLIFIDLLDCLFRSGLFSRSEDEKAPNAQLQVTSIDVCLLGLRGILPLMSGETLKFPTLCSQFYELLAACEFHPEKIYAQPQEFLVNILAVIELGLISFGPNITYHCCGFIRKFADYACSHAAQLPPEKYVLFQPFLKIMMCIVLSQELNSESYRPFGHAFHSLLCCYKECYLQLVEELISSQPEPAIAKRLSEAFTDLTSGLRLETDRQEKANFENNFEKFVFNVQGFLFIK